MKKKINLNLIENILNLIISKEIEINFKEEKENFKITNGLPQGSVLSPNLFNFYINDIKENLNLEKYEEEIILYADDILIITYSFKRVEKIIENLLKYFENNDLKINKKYLSIYKKNLKKYIKMEKIQISESLLFRICNTIRPKFQIHIRKIRFIINLFNNHNNDFLNLLSFENNEMKNFYEKSLIKFDLIKENILELKNLEIINFDKRKLKNYLKNKYFQIEKIENLKLLKEDKNFKKMKKFEFTKKLNNYLKFNIIILQNRITPIYLKEEECRLCEKKHLFNPKEIFENCENKNIKKIIKLYKLFFKIKKFKIIIENLKNEKNENNLKKISIINKLFIKTLFIFYYKENEENEEKFEKKLQILFIKSKEKIQKILI